MEKLTRVLLLTFLLVCTLSPLSSAETPGEDQAHELIRNTTPFQVAFGNPEAAVVVKEYSSLTCPHCRDFHVQVIDQIKESHLDTGKVYYLFRFFPLDMSALRASMLVHCLADSKQKMDFVSQLFQEQAQWAWADSETAFMEQVSSIARKAGIETSGFAECASDKTLEENILYSRMQLIEQAGIRTTPTIYINNVEYTDQRSLNPFLSALDTALLPRKKGNNMLEGQPAMAAIPDTSANKKDCPTNRKKIRKSKDEEPAMAAIPDPDESQKTGSGE